MGKKNRKPEFRDNCDGCNEDTPITAETAYIVNFTRCFGNFVLNKCIHCGRETRLYLSGEVEEDFASQGIPVANTDQIPPPDFVESFLKINGIPLPEEKELTARQDERVTNLGHFLQTIEVTAEDFERTT